MKDSLGDRIKDNYENRTRYLLPRRTYTIIRIDGKAFHTYTKGGEKPFDHALIEDMNSTAIALCEQIQGAKFAYVQSDEISILLTDFDGEQTDAWFDGNVQKICSISASIATAAFNKSRLARELNGDINFTYNTFKGYKWANFDSRTFTIPDPIEVANYFVWRTKDWMRNSVQMFARAYFSHKELEGKSISDIHEMLHLKALNWNDLEPKLKAGRFIEKEVTDIETLRTKWVVNCGPLADQPIFNFYMEKLRPFRFAQVAQSINAQVEDAKDKIKELK